MGSLARLVGLLNRPSPIVKPKLLVVELWGLGDLAIASPFLRVAGEKYAVTLLAKPFAQDLQPRFWPGVEVVPFLAPWTAFRNKYRLNSWPWRQLFGLRKQLASERFDVGLSARWDPRDHVLLKMFGPKKRFGFSRFRSQLFLTHPITRPMPEAHRYEYWRVLGQELGLDLPLREKLPIALACHNRVILVHTGAGQSVRRLRESNYAVKVTCDLSQREWWIKHGEKEVATPETVTELLQLTDQSGLFIGNDSGPGHIAAFCGLPTFTIFGPQLPEWFAPLHPQAEWLEGKACPYKPCFDYCRFPVPRCMENISEIEVWSNVEKFVRRHLPK
jgi:ADP-heptose:LPS heptosyltransferase